jgi:2-amino-4-hydroxy-6-hydroxymethyldihydropteridine diphosphokinase
MRSGIFLLLGTNLGDRMSNLAKARMLIGSAAGQILSASSVFETAAWGKTDQPSFYNQVVVIDTPDDPQQLFTKILSLELTMGRVREEKWGPRLIDIDILFFNDLIVDDVNLKIPHVGIPYRRFVLEPLNEIAPDLFHPGLRKTIRELLQTCTDPSPVKKL